MGTETKTVEELISSIREKKAMADRLTGQYLMMIEFKEKYGVCPSEFVWYGVNPDQTSEAKTKDGRVYYFDFNVYEYLKSYK